MRCLKLASFLRTVGDYEPVRARVLAAEGGGELSPGEGGAPLRLDAIDSGASVEAFEVDFKTVGEFYHKVAGRSSTCPGDILRFLVGWA